jgi:hypothetical protein
MMQSASSFCLIILELSRVVAAIWEEEFTEAVLLAV